MQGCTLEKLQLGLVSGLLIIETIGILLWITCPSSLMPWPPTKYEIINYGHCNGVDLQLNATIQVNPLTHFFAGAIPRMINGHQTKAFEASNIDYDDPTAHILETTIHHREEADLLVRRKRRVYDSRRDEITKEQIELSRRRQVFGECLFLAMAVCVNLALLWGTIAKIPLLFFPWLLVYGFELLAGWAVTLSFLLLPDWFLVSSLVSLLRTSILTWSWICIVRRHLKEVTEIVQRPKLQTIISIATAHPFAPRPDMSDIPILVSSGANAAASPNSNHSFHF